MSQDFFQCLVCHVLFGNLWKVEKHVKQHENEKNNSGESNNRTKENVPLRRGMLPIKKVSFLECFIPIVKNQIDPAFLELCSTVEAKEEPSITVKEDVVASDYLSLEYGDDHGVDDVQSRNEDFGDHSFKRERKPRKCHLKAVANIRRAAAAVLKIPDQSDLCDEEKEDMDYVQDLLDKLSDEDEDDDFKPPSFIDKKGEKRKVGRPFGSLGKRKLASGAGSLVKVSKVGTSSPNKRKRRKVKTVVPDKSKFECEYCSELFSLRAELNMHMYTNHQEQAKMLCCPISPCGKPFRNFFYMREHLYQHNVAERREYALLEQMNSTTTATENNAKNPNAIENLNSSIRCKFCLEKMESLSQLQKHIAEDHDDKSILKCPCCDKNVSEEGIIRFISHLKGYHPKFLDPYDERAKERDEIRLKEQRFKCEKCSATFHYKFQFKNHLESHEKKEKKAIQEENDASRRFACPVCNKKFKFKDNLRRHFTLHLENNPYVCNFPGCNKKFNSDYNLRRHKTLHVESSVTAQRVHCPLCDQSFSRKDKLPRHLREFHKPSDMDTLGTAVKRSKHQSRLPHCGRVPKYPTYKDLNENSAEIANTDTATEIENGEVKVEAVESAATEEIHLVDRIVLDSDGHAVHVKGEQLSPEKFSRNVPFLLAPPAESTSSFVITPTTEAPAPVIQTTSLSKLIVSDPLFEKLAKQDPSKVKDVVTAHYNYKQKRSFDCQICEAVFSRAWTLQLHLKTQHNQTIMDQQQQSTAIESNDEVTNKQPIILMCGTCAYPAKDAKELAKHVKLSHQPKVRCKCGLYFNSKRRLDTHIREIHNGERRFKCKFCSQAFTRRQYVRAHEKKVHEDSSEPIKMKKCPVAGCYREVAPSSYYKHLKSHNDKTAEDELQREKKHKCMLCGDLLCNAMALRRHIDALHLGKPINRRRKNQRLKDATPGAVLRRGPKSAGDEWFQPLLQQMGYAAKNKDNIDVANIEDSLANGEKDETEELASILGF